MRLYILILFILFSFSLSGQHMMLAGGTQAAAPPVGGLLLDDYPGAVAAYSLRELSTALAGQDVIRVRESGSNTEQDFNAAEIINGTLTTFCGTNDGFVVTWYDQSGNGNDAVQITNARQPLLVSNGALILLNGKPAIQFVSTNNWYLEIASITKSTSNTAFNVISRINSGNVPFVYALNQDRNWISSGKYAFSSNSGFLGSNVAAVYDTQTLETINYSLTGFFYRNGIEEVRFSVSPIANTNSAWVGIAGIQTTTYAFNGLMQELIYYPSDQSANRTGIESNINTYYSIY